MARSNGSSAERKSKKERSRWPGHWWLTLLGTLGILLGGWLAFVSRNATAVLVSSVVLLFLSLIGKNWEEFIFKYRDLEAHFRRFALASSELAVKTESTIERVSQESLSEEVQAQLDQLREEIKSLNSELEAQGPSSWSADYYAPAGTISSSLHMPSVLGPKATHEIEDGRVRLKVGSQISSIYPPEGTYRCEVTDPNGQRFNVSVSVPWGVNSDVIVEYPNDFPGAGVSPGTYRVRWVIPSSGVFPASPGISSVLLDTFSIARKRRAKK